MRTEDDMQHPSFLELDRFALGAPRGPHTAAHVAACGHCRAHLDSLRVADPVPAGLRERAIAEAPSGGVLGRLFGARRTWLLGSAGLAVAAAAALLLVVRPAPPPEEAESGYVGVKGLPSVWIYVKHETELSLWDGERPLEVGDLLRLKIDPQGHTHADVFTDEEGAGRLVKVWSGALKADEVTTLPTAWQLDGSQRRESLVVVLGRRGVSPAQARRFVEEGAPPGVWLRRFVLRKAGAETP